VQLCLGGWGQLTGVALASLSGSCHQLCYWLWGGYRNWGLWAWRGPKCGLGTGNGNLPPHRSLAGEPAPSPERERKRKPTPGGGGVGCANVGAPSAVHKASLSSGARQGGAGEVSLFLTGSSLCLSFPFSLWVDLLRPNSRRWHLDHQGTSHTGV
jgi:hypothetical protein